jgi:hypothetical protein
MNPSKANSDRFKDMMRMCLEQQSMVHIAHALACNVQSMATCCSERCHEIRPPPTKLSKTIGSYHRSYLAKKQGFPTMDARNTQQNRENLAQQFRQWAMARNVSLAQTEQMVAAVLCGQYDHQMLQTAQPSTSTYSQQHDIGNVAPAFGFQTPFGTFPIPAMPPLPIQTVPGAFPPPATVVPNMFPTSEVQAGALVPNVQSTMTTFPGGEAIQQSSSYSGQHGSTTFTYSSSSTSMNFSPSPQYIAQPAPPPSIQYIQQPAPPTVAPPQPAPKYGMPAPALAPAPSQSYMQPHLEPQIHPQPQFQPTPVVELPPVPEQIIHPTTANRAPQNSRLADSFKRQLSEATYFSDIPGMPDQGVQR